MPATNLKGHPTATPAPAPFRAAVHRSRGRLHALFSAVCIAVFLLLFQHSSNKTLPATYAICSNPSVPTLIYTVDPDAPIVECIVVRNALIEDRGSLEHIRKRWGDKNLSGPPSSPNPLAPKSGILIKFLKKGQAMYPGFTDAHAHVLGEWSFKTKANILHALLGYGNARQLPLLGSKSVQGQSDSVHTLAYFAHPSPRLLEISDRVISYVLDNPDVFNDTGRWIDGQGWNQNLWEGQNYPLAVCVMTMKIISNNLTETSLISE